MEKDKSNASTCIEKFKSVGIRVVQRANMHQKFTIAEKIVWYGSVNLLSYGNAEESMMRLESYELSAELEGILQNASI